jgi:hypothetical protein
VPDTTSALENFLTPAAEITIAGKVYKLVFDFFAVAEIEEKTGRNLLEKDGWNNLNGTALSVFFWATLQFNYPEITLKAARRLMNSKNILLIEEAIAHAWSLSKPEVKEQEAKDPQ